MIILARGPRKTSYGVKKPFVEKHNQRNQGGQKKRMLDMGRRKYFQFDLGDLLEEFKIEDNKNNLASTLLNKLMTHSLDDAKEYLERVKQDNNIDDTQAERINQLMVRYTRWR